MRYLFATQAAAVLLALAGPAAAQAPMPPMGASPPQHQEAMALRASCGSDYRRYCSAVRLGGGRAIACLQAHDRQLSPRCRSSLLAARQSR